ncbi:uncharacterized protein LOC118440885 [Vespa mandarinia]|uniref:uncharacterized protein LOC118440885 n=1 Tax=Vespa mandarinia TaxID=7446 RepID=UPI001618C698|nr:uncharacterized protein LOC118440885 [Vespa mandarinia]
MYIYMCVYTHTHTHISVGTCRCCCLQCIAIVAAIAVPPSSHRRPAVTTVELAQSARRLGSSAMLPFGIPYRIAAWARARATATAIKRASETARSSGSSSKIREYISVSSGLIGAWTKRSCFSSHTTTTTTTTTMTTAMTIRRNDDERTVHVLSLLSQGKEWTNDDTSRSRKFANDQTATPFWSLYVRTRERATNEREHEPTIANIFADRFREEISRLRLEHRQAKRGVYVYIYIYIPRSLFCLLSTPYFLLFFFCFFFFFFRNFHERKSEVRFLSLLLPTFLFFIFIFFFFFAHWRQYTPSHTLISLFISRFCTKIFFCF